jgi:hypothetical protein
MASMRFYALILGLLVSGPFTTSSLWAQAEKQRGARPVGFDVAYEWKYSCPDGRGCSFTCAGSGGAGEVTKLNIYLGSVPIARAEHTAGIFYEFSTKYVAHGNGFAVTTGIGTLSCQAQGMKLDYSGPADKSKESEDIPTASINRR